MIHQLDLDAPKSVSFELYIEEVEISQNRASTSDCLATASSFSTAGGCVGSFSSVGSVASTGGGGGCGGSCH
jgi:hypothetical protein